MSLANVKVEIVTSSRSATPTEKQYERLLVLGSGSAWLSARRRLVEPLMRHGWVTARQFDGHYWQFVRITPDGLRALAAGAEKYGLPDMRPRQYRMKERARDVD